MKKVVKPAAKKVVKKAAVKKSIPKAQNGRKLTDKELSALAHQKRGMGSLDFDHWYVKKSGPVKNELGNLDDSMKKQLRSYMNKSSTAEKIYQALPNVGRILGDGYSAADIPEKSPLKKRNGGAIKKVVAKKASLKKAPVKKVVAKKVAKKK